MSDSKSAIAERKRQRKRAELIQRASLAGGTLAAMAITPLRSWWMIALSVAFGWWAQSRVRAHRSNVSETLGQRSWAIIAQLQGEYRESEIETLRLLDTRVVMAVESGDLASIEPLLDEVESIVTPDDAARAVHDLRAFVLAARGETDAAKRSLARANVHRPWAPMAQCMINPSEGPTAIEAIVDQWMHEDATPPMRALWALLGRGRSASAVYRRPAKSASTRVAYESWMRRVAPALADALVPWPSLTSAVDASWNHRSTNAPVAVPTRPWRDRLRTPWALTMVSLAVLQALALLRGIEFVRAPTAALVGMFLVPLVGLAASAFWAWAQRRDESATREMRVQLGANGRSSARFVRRLEHVAIEQFLRTQRVESSREALALVWALGAPRDRALLLRTHAVTLAWAGLEEESEAVLARLDEDFASYTHTTTARFEARLVSAVVREDRARAAKIAREYVDTLPVSRSVESLWKCAYAALVDRSLRDEARAQVSWAPQRARWLMALLEDDRVRIDASDERDKRADVTNTTDTTDIADVAVSRDESQQSRR